MITKLLIALAVAVAGWWLWKGPEKSWTSGQRKGGPVRTPPLPMLPEERKAFRVLGLNPGASEQDIRAAHRRLLIEFHPDHGGSAEAAREVNAARDTLLKRDD